MNSAADAMPLVISAMTGMFPGAPDVDAFWQRIRCAEPAPLTDLGPRWGVAKERYLADKPGVPDRTYVDHAFCLPEDAGSSLSDLPDRQARIGQAVLRDLLAKLPGSVPQRTGFVLATEWTGASYFERTAYAALASEPDIDLPPPPAQGFTPDEQLAAIAEGLTGPHFAIDTACASSLYGLDLARRLIRTGQADGVVVMGLTAWLPLFLLTSFSQLMALSPKQHILPYAASADGIVLGEACAALLVEPLASALAAKRPILAVIRQQSLSADGADRSVFAPGRDGQRLMYKRAYQAFAPGSLDYLEGHGTATKLGDDTELAIMLEFFGPHYRPEQALPIGSVKGLIGHTLAAAGISSLIKTILMLQAKELPPHNPVTPNAVLSNSTLTLKTSVTPWLEPADRPRRAGVSAFGFGGSNAHVILEEYQPSSTSSAIAAPSAKPVWRPLAIVDFDAVFGSATHLGEMQTRLQNARAFGQQFPATLDIEAQGLRMGPNFLKRTDPYQLLITELAHRIAQRQPELANDADAGVVIGSNLGGALTHKIMQRSQWLAHHRDSVRNAAARADRFGPKHSLESIASCLPNMCSGYPSFHFNLRAFHQTLSGGPSLFWDALALAGDWLHDSCQRLLIGAGRINKHAGENAAEGAALFLLQDAAQTQEPLAILHALISATEAPDLASACAMVGFPVEQFDWHGICNLDEVGALGEAQGTDLLASALLAAQRWAAIEVRQGGALRYTLLLEKCSEPTLRPLRQQLPLTIALHETAPTPIKLATPSCVTPENARLWLQSTSTALHGFFASQRANLKLLPATLAAPQPLPCVHILDRSPAHIVIATPEHKPDGQLTAQLKVDETHPYFFDHPLDHVPGILMLEGMLQLAEWGAQAPAGQEAYIQSVKLSFRRFCEKGAPVVIRMVPERTLSPAPLPHAGEGRLINRFAGTVSQKDEIACRFNLGIAYAAATSNTVSAQNTGERPDLKLLHKHLAENVLVTPLFDLPGGSKACQTHTPPAGHILADGSPRYHGMLYLLETVRQFIMLIAHTVWEVPLGLPMNLLSIQLDLDAPAPRALPLTISHHPTRLDTHAESAIVLVETQLHAGEQLIGKAAIVAQALTPEAYRKQRHDVGAQT